MFSLLFNALSSFFSVKRIAIIILAILLIVGVAMVIKSCGGEKKQVDPLAKLHSPAEKRKIDSLIKISKTNYGTLKNTEKEVDSTNRSLPVDSVSSELSNRFNQIASGGIQSLSATPKPKSKIHGPQHYR